MLLFPACLFDESLVHLRRRRAWVNLSWLNMICTVFLTYPKSCFSSTDRCDISEVDIECINKIYILYSYSKFNEVLALKRTPNFSYNLFSARPIFYFQVECFNIVTSRNFRESLLSIMSPYSSSGSSFKGILSPSVILWNNIYFVLSENLLPRK